MFRQILPQDPLASVIAADLAAGLFYSAVLKNGAYSQPPFLFLTLLIHEIKGKGCSAHCVLQWLANS